MKTITKFIFNSNFKRYLIVLFLLFIYILVSAFSYVNAISSNIENSVFRLHVIANSDSEEDQNLKYKIRDNILNYINKSSKNTFTKEDVVVFIEENIDKLKTIAQNTVYENGFSYEVSVEMGNFNFPTKTYGDITFPPGFYDALRIKIGDAKGQNWWCVMFPPLCFIDISSGIVPEESKDIIKNHLSDKEFNLISEHNGDMNFKFKIVEMFQNISIKLAQS